MIQVRAQIRDRELHGAVHILHLHAPDLARQLHPGQAVLIQTGWYVDPFLRRTFYPVAIDDAGFAIRLAPDADRGRAWLRMPPQGAEIDILGPVGRGYALPERTRRILCLGQGDAAWTLLPLVHAASAQGLGVALAMEASTKRQTIPPRDLPITVEYHVATLDGSAGRRGDLRPLLPDLLRWADAVMAAGSLDFYHVLARMIEDARMILPRDYAQALYQTDFLCGFGACQACAADVAGGRRRVCLRGPVFDLVDILR